jgi:hypothetical protein
MLNYTDRLQCANRNAIPFKTEGMVKLLLEREVKEGSGDGTSLSVGALREEPGRGAPLLGTYKDM